MPPVGSSPRQQQQHRSSSTAGSSASSSNLSTSAASASSLDPKAASKRPLSEILTKAATPKAAWSNKDELLDVVYWQRQLLSALLGLVWGLLPLKGILGLALFFLVNCAAVYLYTCVFQGVDDEEYGGLGEILKEGLMTSFASFLVVWIIVYDHVHADSLASGPAGGVA